MDHKNTSNPETEKTSMLKFLKYAVGEIALVMIGILLALQVNNWNEKRLENIKLNTYRTNLIAEIKTDLKNIDEHIENIKYYKNSVIDYVAYYNKPDLNIDTLVDKLTNLEYYLDDFETTIYTIDDLISTGNISIFPEEEKEAIYTLKNEIEKLNEVEKSSQKDVEDRWDVFYSNVDELHEYGYSDKQHPKVANWYYDLSSDEYRMQHNVFAIVLYLYDKQLDGLFPGIQEELNSTKSILEKNVQ